MQSGDGLIVFLVALALGAWVYFYARSKLKEAVEDEPPFEFLADTEVPEDEATELLEARGYSVLSGKKRIPVHIKVNRSETLQCRLFVDYTVEKNGRYYIVKTAKERKLMERTGSGVRDHLLVYQLLYPKTAGVVYVNVPEQTVDCYVFELQAEDDDDTETP